MSEKRKSTISASLKSFAIAATIAGVLSYAGATIFIGDERVPSLSARGWSA